MKEEYKLPEKWCIKATKNSEVHKWFNKKLNRTVSVDSNIGSYFHFPEMLYRTCTSEKVNVGYKEISFEEFNKYVLKNQTMEKEIIGYKVPHDIFMGHIKKDTVYTLRKHPYNCSPVGYNDNNCYCLPQEIVKTWEPVYKEEKKLPKIGNYEGQYKDKYITYGCAKLHENFFICLTGIKQNEGYEGNRSVKSIKLDSGVEITMEQVKGIVEYINSQK